MSYAIDPMRRHNFRGFDCFQTLPTGVLAGESRAKEKAPHDFAGLEQTLYPQASNLATTEEAVPPAKTKPHIQSHWLPCGSSPRHSRRADWEKFERLWWRCGFGVPGTMRGTALRRWTAFKLGCLMILASRFDLKEEQNQFLGLLEQLPARLTAEQVAWVLNCQAHNVPVLVAAKLLAHYIWPVCVYLFAMNRRCRS
jgi:hypothetical protein